MGLSRATNASNAGSFFKENRPPMMSARTVSVSALFNQTDHLRRKHAEAARDPLAPRPAGITKPAVAKERLFAKFSKPKTKEHPVYTSFKGTCKTWLPSYSNSPAGAETINKYKQEAHQAGLDRLQPIYEELIARVDGLDVNGQPLNMPGVPSQADVDALIAEDEKLSKPLDDDILQIEDRSGRVRDVRLGDLMRKFDAKSEEKREEIAELLLQLKAVDTEIVAAQKDALHAEKVDVKKLRDKLAVQLEGFKDQALRIKEQTEAEVKAALEEDKKAKREWEAKVAALTE